MRSSIKDKIADVEVIKNEYEESCKDVEFTLDMEVINSEKAKVILGG